MNTLRTKLNLLVLSLFVLAVVGCNPEDGDTGPVGPVGSPGATGPKGDTGPPGQDGQDGLDGNANVSAITFSLPSTAWSTGTIKTYSRGVAEITQDVVDDGLVMVYQRQAPDTDWGALPFTYNITLSSGGQTFNAIITTQFSYDTDSLFLTNSNSLRANITNSATFPGDREYKVVIIPPANLVQGMNYEDHEMLQAVYGI